MNDSVTVWSMYNNCDLLFFSDSMNPTCFNQFMFDASLQQCWIIDSIVITFILLLCRFWLWSQFINQNILLSCVESVILYSINWYWKCNKFNTSGINNQYQTKRYKEQFWARKQTNRWSTIAIMRSKIWVVPIPWLICNLKFTIGNLLVSLYSKKSSKLLYPMKR